MATMCDCPKCGARAMSARDKLFWLEPSRAIPCAACGERLSLPVWRWLAGGIPLYLLLLLVFAGQIQSWRAILAGAAVAIALGLAHKVWVVPLVEARRSASTAAPWRAGNRTKP